MSLAVRVRCGSAVTGGGVDVSALFLFIFQKMFSSSAVLWVDLTKFFVSKNSSPIEAMFFA